MKDKLTMFDVIGGLSCLFVYLGLFIFIALIVCKANGYINMSWTGLGVYAVLWISNLFLYIYLSKINGKKNDKGA